MKKPNKRWLKWKILGFNAFMVFLFIQSPAYMIKSWWNPEDWEGLCTLCRIIYEYECVIDNSDGV